MGGERKRKGAEHCTGQKSIIRNLLISANRDEKKLNVEREDNLKLKDILAVLLLVRHRDLLARELQHHEKIIIKERKIVIYNKTKESI